MGYFPRYLGGSINRHIYILSEPITHESLASTHVNTPDPAHYANSAGHQLTISWNIPKEHQGKELQGILKVRFVKDEQQEIPFAISKKRGYFTYKAVDDDYFPKGGLLTYQVTILANGEVIDTYSHQLWKELILIAPNRS